MLKRTFTYVDQNGDRHEVVALIHAPQKQDRPKVVPQEPDTYSCAFEVTGADLNIKGMGFGAFDGLAALFAALRDLRLELDKLGNRIGWIGLGYTGIPRMVTLADPIPVQQRIEAVLDNEHQMHSILGPGPKRGTKP
ncbi:DUF6968 family protein [Steroidobacter flavus]|uniref:DUF6968 family protein n=1 Tax=Steroidobacter flavus TaxID=1842136 RepID=A0ABV8SPH7_9GAMM